MNQKTTNEIHINKQPHLHSSWNVMNDESLASTFIVSEYVIVEIDDFVFIWNWHLIGALRSQYSFMNILTDNQKSCDVFSLHVNCEYALHCRESIVWGLICDSLLAAKSTKSNEFYSSLKRNELFVVISYHQCENINKHSIHWTKTVTFTMWEAATAGV